MSQIRSPRLSQYALLGVGGVRALAGLGIEPALVHLNEGHAAFSVLELARTEVARGLPVEAALEVADGLQRSWLARRRPSIRTLAPGFCAGRMPDDYLQRIYTPTTTSLTG
jgi:glucan phosphorylase